MTLLFLTMIIKAALLSAMMMVPNTASQMPTLDKDTFERFPKTEYVTEPNNYIDSVYVLNSEPVGNKERGENFNKWFWDMIACANDDGSFNAQNLNGASIDFEIKNKDYKQLAADIVSTFDKNGDNKVNYDEYTKKSEELVNQKAGRTLNTNEMEGFYKDFFIPWFNGFFDYDRYYDEYLAWDFLGDVEILEFVYDRNYVEYSIDEVAATLYALDKSSSGGNGYIRGDKLLQELGYVMDNNRPSVTFENNRANYYQNNKINY